MICEAPASPLLEAVQVTRTGHADDRKIEALIADQVRERGEDLLVGKIAGRPEEDERIRAVARTAGRTGFGSRARHGPNPSVLCGR